MNCKNCNYKINEIITNCKSCNEKSFNSKEFKKILSHQNHDFDKDKSTIKESRMLDTNELIKKCKTCLKEKSITDFYTTKKGYIFPHCNVCKKIKSLKYRDENRQKERDRHTKYRQLHKSHMKDYYAKNKEVIKRKVNIYQKLNKEHLKIKTKKYLEKKNKVPEDSS